MVVACVRQKIRSLPHGKCGHFLVDTPSLPQRNAWSLVCNITEEKDLVCGLKYYHRERLGLWSKILPQRRAWSLVWNITTEKGLVCGLKYYHKESLVLLPEILPEIKNWSVFWNIDTEKAWSVVWNILFLALILNLPKWQSVWYHPYNTNSFLNITGIHRA